MIQVNCSELEFETLRSNGHLNNLRLSPEFGHVRIGDKVRLVCDLGVIEGECTWGTPEQRGGELMSILIGARASTAQIAASNPPISKIISMVAVGDRIVVLCDDGTLWREKTISPKLPKMSGVDNQKDTIWEPIIHPQVEQQQLAMKPPQPK